MAKVGSTKVRTCLWFERHGEEAARYYVSLLDDSHIESFMRPDPDGEALVIDFTLAGAPFMALNGGPHYKLTPACSISVSTKDQEETDRLWEALIKDGGEASMCGWLVDRFGVSWQIVPKALIRLLSDDDREAADRAKEAMLKMRKISIAELEAAFAGN